MLIVGFVLAALVGVAGWRWGALTKGGAAGATLIGGLVFGFGGPTWGALLVAFFLSSSALTFLATPRKRAIGIDSDHSRRRGEVVHHGGRRPYIAFGWRIWRHHPLVISPVGTCLP